MNIGMYIGRLNKYGSGIQVYVNNLVSSIKQIKADINITLLYNFSRTPFGSSSYKELAPSTRQMRLLIPERYALRLWHKFMFPPIDIGIKNLDLIHCATSFVPPVKKTKTIVTVYDLTCAKYPDLLIISKDRARAIISTIKNAGLIIAISHNTKRDIIELLNVNKQKVKVIYCGLDPVYLKKIDKSIVNATLKKYGVNFPYFLFVGNIDPRKNIKRLVTAFKKFLSIHDRGEKLILIGATNTRSTDELMIIKELNLEAKVHHLGYVLPGDLPCLYAGARIFAYPSLYEGFGMPVLEAMASGVPVITSNVSSLPEVAANAALYVSPQSVDELTLAFEKLSNDEDLRSELINKGYKRARNFKWSEAGQEVINCYHELVGH